MISPNDLNALLEQIRSQLGQGPFFTAQKNRSMPHCGGQDAPDKSILLSHITPAKVLVIAGFLAGALEVRSVMIDRDQIVNILLEGSLKRKTKLDKMLDEIGKMPFDDEQVLGLPVNHFIKAARAVTLEVKRDIGGRDEQKIKGKCMFYGNGYAKKHTNKSY